MVHRKVFGDASDFYRVRLVRVEEESPPQLEWRSDILYRKESNNKYRSATKYKVEVVNLDSDRKYLISAYPKRVQALKKLNLIENDLRELTRIQFENKYNFFEIGEEINWQNQR